MKSPNYNAIQKEMQKNKEGINSGAIDVYEFLGYLSIKYIKPIDGLWDERTTATTDPYTDLLHAMLDINEIETY